MTNFLSNTVRRFSRTSSVKGGNASDHHQSTPPPSSYTQAPATSGPASVRSTSSRNQPGGLTALPASGSRSSSVHSTGPVISHPIPVDQHAYTNRFSSDTAGMPNGVANDSRPISSATDQSFDFANRPVSNRPESGSLPQSTAYRYQQQAQSPTTHQQSVSQAVSSPNAPAYTMASSRGTATGGLSRTDQIVLRHFWEDKYQENTKRDLHYLKFPFFPQVPSHKDLLPYCEIYHLVKTSPGANIISLGSANGVYIGFELQTGSQLHIDMDDEWHNISHHRVHFRPYESILRDGTIENTFKSWPKPLTIEFLEEQYQNWCLDLMSLCWEGKEVRELGGSGGLPAEQQQYPHQQTGATASTGLGPSSIPAQGNGPIHHEPVGGVSGMGHDRKF